MGERKVLTKTAAAAAKSLQSCPTLCNLIDVSPPSSPVPGILQAKTLEWVAISFSNAWKWKVKVKSLSHVWLSDPMDCSLPGSSIHGICQEKYWSGVPSPSPGVICYHCFNIYGQHLGVSFYNRIGIKGIGQSKWLQLSQKDSLASFYFFFSIWNLWVQWSLLENHVINTTTP